MLTEGLIIGQPYATIELPIGEENKQIIVCQVLSVAWEVRGHDKSENGECFAPGYNVFDPVTLFFGELRVKLSCPSRRMWDCGSICPIVVRG